MCLEGEFEIDYPLEAQDFAFPSSITLFATHKMLFSQQWRKDISDKHCSDWGTADSESNVFPTSLSFQAHTLKQCPIKKLHKVAIGKTILKSTASANKPAGPLSLYPAKRKLVRIRKAIIDSLKTLDAHISGLRCKVKC